MTEVPLISRKSDTAAGYKEHYTTLKDVDSSLTLISPITTIVAPANDGAISDTETKSLDQFFLVCQDCKIDAVAFSWHGSPKSIDQFRRNVDEISSHFAKPVWVIGVYFADNDLAAESSFIRNAVKFLDGNANVQGYAVRSFPSTFRFLTTCKRALLTPDLSQWDYSPLVWKLEDGTIALSPSGKAYVGESLSEQMLE